MFARRRPVSLVGTSAWIASAEDVILHKLFWNKLMPFDRQLLDAAGIWAVQATQLDMDYMNRWARVLQIESEFERIRRGEIRPKGS